MSSYHQQMAHHSGGGDDEQSEDGQLASPYGGGGHGQRQQQDRGDSESFDEDTNDSLDIKPPQAIKQNRSERYKEKRSTRDKKHSRDHRHKDRDHRERIDERSSSYDHRTVRHSHTGRSSGHLSSSNSGMVTISSSSNNNNNNSSSSSNNNHRTNDRYDVQHGRDRNDFYRSATNIINREQQQQIQLQTESNNHRHRQKSSQQQTREHDRSDKSRHKEYDRRKTDNIDTKSEAERAMQDLRNRLLSKRNKNVDGGHKSSGNGGGGVDNTIDSNNERHTMIVDEHIEYRSESIRYEQYENNRREKDRTSEFYHRQHHHQQQQQEQQQQVQQPQYRNNEQKRDKKNVIELVDSPETYQTHSTTANSKYITTYKEELSRIVEDPEQIARRTRLLDAERERARRTEKAREELEARREQRRLRDERKHHHHSLQEKKKKKHKALLTTYDDTDENDDDDDDEDYGDGKRIKHKKKKRHAKETITVSDNTEEEEDDDDDDDECDHEHEDHHQKNSANDEDENDDTASNSDTNSDTDESEDQLEQSDGELPDSPLSVPGNLSKSERKKRRSHTRSHTGSSHHHHNHTASRSKSISQSGSSQTRSRSRSLHSRSPRRVHKNRSRRRHSNTPTSDFEKDKNPDQPNDKNKSSNYYTMNTMIDIVKTPEHPMDVEDEEEEEEEVVLPDYYPGIQGCRSVEEFQRLNRIDEGTYGVVYRARDKRTEEIVALKRLKMEKEKDGFPITSLREINTLLKGQHPNIVTVREIVVGSDFDRIFIVMDYVEHDLKSLMEIMKHRKQSFLPGEVKCLLQQLLRAVAHLHDNWILHRDLKTSNLLLSHKGILKVGDFGLAREYGSPLKKYTSVVVTLYYRAPELLLCCKEYSTPIDMWSVGCIFGELLSMGAIFTGKSDIDQLNRIFKELGTPNENIWPGYNQLPAVQKITFTEYPVSNLRKKFNQTTEQGIALIQGLLTYDPKQRLTAENALKHPYFKEFPLPVDPSMFPTWPAKSELGAKKAMASSPKPPSGGAQFKLLLESENNHGFILNHPKTNSSNALRAAAQAAAIIKESRQINMGPGFSLKF